MSQFIDTRASAEQEAKRLIRGKKRGNGVEFLAAAAYRRDSAKFSLQIAENWKRNGERGNALLCTRIARGHLIIARALERAANT